MEKISYICLAIVVTVMILGIGAFIWEDNADCSDLGGLSLKDLPARCVGYYQK